MGKYNVYDNRELSWLKFNERVIEEAEDESVPLFERLKFVGIFCSNLDEFFMIRVGTLYDQSLLKLTKKENKTNLTPLEQLDLISHKVKTLIPRKDSVYENILDGLKEEGISHERISDLSKDDMDYIQKYFEKDIKPLLFPGMIDKKHPFPFFKNNEIYVGALLKKKTSTKSSESYKIGVLSAAGGFDKIIFLKGDKIRFLLVEDVILHFCGQVFDNFDIKEKFIFRITRNADIDVNEALYDQDVDFREVMEEIVKKRKKLNPVRIEFNGKISDETVHLISKGLGLQKEYVFLHNTPLDLKFISQIEDKLNDRKELFFEKLEPQKSAYINPDESILKQVLKNDIFISYPYESFSHFEQLLREAADDENVVSIKITLYRVASDSKIISNLIRAAENGKDVLVLLELRARFDEENNISWSKQLEQAGVNVIYGLDELKVHSKLLQITRKSGHSIQYITQIGTGNYNEKTSRLYTDFTLITSNSDIGAEASVVFNALSMGTTVQSSNVLLIAPNCMKNRIISMIDNEIAYGENGYIGIKINSLTDKDIIEKLLEANRKGVKIEMIVRGICCMISGVPQKSENIKIISIVGRFLEHSRLYIFGKSERQQMFISSADFMTRNTERRVEVAVPILDRKIRDRLLDMFNTMLLDNVKARIQLSDGTYLKRKSDNEQLDSQLYFYQQAYQRAKDIPAKFNLSLLKRGFKYFNTVRKKLFK